MGKSIYTIFFFLLYCFEVEELVFEKVVLDCLMRAESISARNTWIVT
jgi:hypothetical protein